MEISQWTALTLLVACATCAFRDDPVVAPLTMHGLEAEAIQSALASHKSSQKTRARALRWSARSESAQNRLQSQAKQYTSSNTQAGLEEEHRIESAAREMHSVRNARTTQLLRAVAQRDESQATELDDLQQDAAREREHQTRRAMRLGQNVLQSRQLRSIEKNHKQKSVRLARIKTLKQANRLTNEAVALMGDAKEQGLAGAVQRSQLKALRLLRESASAKEDVMTDHREMKLAGRKEEALISNELKYKNAMAQRSVNSLGDEVAKFENNRKREVQEDLRDARDDSQDLDHDIKVHGAWKLGKHPEGLSMAQQPCTSIARLENDPLCHFTSTLGSQRKTSETSVELAADMVHRVEHKLRGDSSKQLPVQQQFP